MPRSVVRNTSSGFGGSRPSTPRSVRSIGRAGQSEEAVVAVLALRDEQAGRHAAGAAHQAGREIRIALGIGDGFAEDLVVDRHQAQRDVGDRAGRAERAHHGVQAVIAGKRGEAEIGDDEPLRRLGAPFLRVVHRLGGEDVGAGLELLLQLADRDRRRDLAVDLARDVDRAGPHFLAGPRGDLVGLPFAELAQEIAVGDGAGELAVADAEERGFDLVGVDRSPPGWSARRRPAGRRRCRGSGRRARGRARRSRAARSSASVSPSSAGRPARTVTW